MKDSVPKKARNSASLPSAEEPETKDHQLDLKVRVVSAVDAGGHGEGLTGIIGCARVPPHWLRCGGSVGPRERRRGVQRGQRVERREGRWGRVRLLRDPSPAGLPDCQLQPPVSRRTPTARSRRNRGCSGFDSRRGLSESVRIVPRHPGQLRPAWESAAPRDCSPQGSRIGTSCQWLYIVGISVFPDRTGVIHLASRDGPR
jgi:hypothetical protein